VKLPLPRGATEARALLGRHGFAPLSPRQLETDQTFDLPAGDLKKSDRLLRLRAAGGAWRVTYKGPANRDRHKTRQEIEIEVSDGEAFAELVSALGYRPGFAYQKYRTTFRTPGEEGIVALDETPIGDFLELEGPESWIDRTALRLGFGPKDYITSSYAALYEDYRRTRPAVPADMKFQRP